MNCGLQQDDLASVARQMGAQVVRGPVRYAAHERSAQVGDVEIDSLLHEMAAYEVLLIVAPLDLESNHRLICPLCGGSSQGGECPDCKAEREGARRSQEERLLFGEGFSALLCSE
jgi:hypothetical protein